MTTSQHEPRPAPRTGGTGALPAAGGPTRARVRSASSVPQAFDLVADTWPNRTAVEWDTGRWSYRDLQTASRNVERRLRSAGVLPGEAVAVVGDRSAETCATMLGILRAGAAYVPVDTNLPAVRVRAMLDTAGVNLAVRPAGSRADGRDGVHVVDLVRTERAGATGDSPGLAGPAGDSPVGDGLADDALLGDADLDRTAYVMFTSGSTGRPKAVAVRQRGILRLATDNGFLHLDPANRFMHAASLSFDASTLEIWPTLLSGACLVIVDQALLLAPAALRDTLRATAIDSIFLTTGVFHQVARSCPELFDGLRYAITGGEVLNPLLAAHAVGRATYVVNGYGPTESTVMATAHVLGEADAGPVPIGTPLPYVSVAVLAPDGSPVDPGEDGELHVAGDGLAAGYLGDPAETARRFVHLSIDGAPPVRYYRTGDQVRWGEAGLLEFRGRLDDQVKVRGHRIQLTEVERALSGIKDIGEAAVVAVEDGASRVLVAFCTPAGPVAPVPDPTSVRRALAAILPASMLPATVVPVDALPFTANGKVDRRVLSDRASAATSHPAAGGVPGAPQDAREAVDRAWRETLVVDVVDPDGDFFELGGNSLMAAQLIARVQSSLALDGAHGHVLIRGLLSDPRPAAFTAVVDEIVGRPAGSPAPDGADRWRPDVRLLPRPAPVTRVHQPDPAAQDPRPAPVTRVHQPAPVAPGHRPDPPAEVLLTGATGFFGSALLRELVERTGSTVRCLVRAADEDAAMARVLAAQRRYGHGPLTTDRVVAVPGDLTAHRLGLDDATWESLAARTDLIHHSGAHVNFVYPYEWLRRTNVDGTRSLVELAEAGGGIPLHYVSTIAVLAGSGSAAVRHVTEDTPLDHVERLSMGYPESKWVAEQILRAASARGLPVVVHRPYEITGSTVDGHWNTEAAICAFFKAIVEMGRAPDVDLPLDFVPVDHLARAVVHLARTRPAEGQTYHLTNPRYALLGLMVERLRAHGHLIEVVDYDTWLHDLSAFCAEHPQHPIVSFLPIFTNIASSSTLTVKELYFEGTFPRFGRERADAHLAGSGIVCPPVDAEMLDSYVRWFHSVGYIDRPRVGAR
ncbi:amino acid adenylation domain-containing protein [Oerskovia sp. NPDC057915]|uniref:amino acid adenylation domain-containing protein n=1 Tax=Oerskovia sp. NPDC057915 TaxID=3346280 RepID=UPI0036DC9B82